MVRRDVCDIIAYANTFGISNPNYQRIYCGNNPPVVPGSGRNEVTLDIQLVLGIVPNAKVLVYIAPNTGDGDITIYNQIAIDNLASVVSTSWGEDEIDSQSSILYTENNIFKQMAAQGQSMFASSGDGGAFGKPNSKQLVVSDPASQPFVTGVGKSVLRIIV